MSYYSYLTAWTIPAKAIPQCVLLPYEVRACCTVPAINACIRVGFLFAFEYTVSMPTVRILGLVHTPRVYYVSKGNNPRTLSPASYIMQCPLQRLKLPISPDSKH
jgi:hypothetical protein